MVVFLDLLVLSRTVNIIVSHRNVISKITTGPVKRTNHLDNVWTVALRSRRASRRLYFLPEVFL